VACLHLEAIDSDTKTDDRFGNQRRDAYFTDGCAASASVCSKRVIKKKRCNAAAGDVVRHNDSLRGNQLRNVANNAPLVSKTNATHSAAIII
jgi:hypothetical protein